MSPLQTLKAWNMGLIHLQQLIFKLSFTQTNYFIQIVMGS